MKPIDARQWIRDTLSLREQEAVPYNFMFSPPAEAILRRHYATEDLEEALALPIRMSGPDTIKPLYADPHTFGPRIQDEFGVVWTTSRIDRGAPVGPCLERAGLSGYRFPDPAREYRFAGLGDWCRRNRESYAILWVGDLWERATFMRGMQELLLDVALHPRFVRRLLEGITGYILETMRILFERFEFDGIAVSDDYGTQAGMIIAPEAWRRLVKPLLGEIYALARRNGRTVFHHSCGNILPIIPDLIGMGLDILHPIQPEAMDVLALKREFGRDLAFCGGLGTQRLLPRGSPEEVRREVRRLKNELGRGGGYILEPGITVQADVPLANLLAMIEQARAAD
jgi:uroporphyrinogen decarboxylase